MQLDPKIKTLAHELGLMKDNKVIVDIDGFISEFPKDLLDDLNAGILLI